MTIQQTLVLIKPDGVMKGSSCIDGIKARYVAAGLSIKFEYPVYFSQEDAGEFYLEHKGRFYYEGLVLAMSSGPCRAIILEGENAIEEVRRLNGPTDPSKAPEGTIRCDFRSAGGPFNTVHASDGLVAFTRELGVVIEVQKNIS